MAIRCGANLHRWTDEHGAPDVAVERALMAIRPGILVCSNPDWEVLWRYMAANPDTLVILRVFDGDNYDCRGSDPLHLADLTALQIAGHEALIDAVQSYNEAATTANAAEQLPRELAYVRAMHALGVKVCALNAAVGNLDPEAVPLMLDLWQEADWIGYHGYISPDATDMDPEDCPWFVRRPEKLWLPTLAAHGLDLSKLILTETGTYSAPPISDAFTWADYGRLLLAINDYAESIGAWGTAGWLLAGWEPWRTQQKWELVGTEAVDVLAASESSPGQPQDKGEGGGTAMADFVLGFKELADRLGAAVVGEPETDEKTLHNPDGSNVATFQSTAKGVMFYQDGGSPKFLASL